LRRIGRFIAVVALLLALLFVAAYAALQPPEARNPELRDIALRGVRVVRPGTAPSASTTLSLHGDRIASIGDEDAPGTEPVDDYKGMLAVPGLVDMHVHFPLALLPGEVELFGLLFLAHGVTAVRDVGSIDHSTLELRRRSGEGRFVGPRVFACGPFVDGDPPVFAATQPERIGRAEDAEAVVDALAMAGADCIKVYSAMSAEVLIAVQEAAARNGLPVIGHVPEAILFEQAQLDDVQHLTGVLPKGETPRFDWLRAWGGLDEERRTEIVAASLQHGIAHTPTIAVSNRISRLGDYASMRKEPVMRYLPPYYIDVLWNPALNPFYSSQAPTDFKRGLPRVEMMKRLLAQLHAAGVAVFTGTDTTGPPFLVPAFTVPGASLQEELAHFVDAGLTPEDAWIASSRAPAEILGMQDLGLLRAGAPADFLLLRNDPTQDLAALDSLEAVVVDGRLYPRSWIIEELERKRAYFNSPIYSWVSTRLARSLLALLRAPG
jgi:cytosine/adenosine deaminase-related metal-dependent hydrolase